MGRKKTYDREEVLGNAMDLFWEAGFEGAHLSELVEATGLNRFGLYKEFGGKEGLFEEALTRYLALGRDVYQEHLGREPKGLENIRSYFSAIQFGPDYHGCFMINTLTEKYVVSARAFEMAKKFSSLAERLYLENLKAAKSSGELADETDVQILAKLLLTIDQGMAIYGITRPNNRTKNQIVRLMLERLLGSGVNA
jgi:AcrR family transcriptional regulator